MKQDTIRVGAVIAAGGMAQRMQGVDKQLLELNGVPVLVRSIQALAQVRSIRELVVVARQDPRRSQTLCPAADDRAVHPGGGGIWSGNGSGAR